MNDDSAFVPKTIESKGKTIDEAIFAGMQELGLSIDQVDILTLKEGSKGILGIGARPYVVKLTQKSPDFLMDGHVAESIAKPLAKPPVKQELESKENASVRSSKSTETENKCADDKAEAVKNASEMPIERSSVSDSSSDNEKISSISRVTEKVDYQPYIQGESECPGAEFLTGTMERMGVVADLEYYYDEKSVKFRITSTTKGILIGHRGETLDALQYLTNLVINRQAEAYRYVLLDTGDYRKKREEALIRLASKTAIKVQNYGRSIALEPMKPYERRVMHATIQNYEGVYTFSKGDEGRRFVVVAVDRDSQKE